MPCICNTHSKTPIEFLYLETSAKPLKYMISTWRLMYLQLKMVKYDDIYGSGEEKMAGILILTKQLEVKKSLLEQQEWSLPVDNFTGPDTSASKLCFADMHHMGNKSSTTTLTVYFSYRLACNWTWKMGTLIYLTFYSYLLSVSIHWLIFWKDKSVVFKKIINSLQNFKKICMFPGP